MANTKKNSPAKSAAVETEAVENKVDNATAATPEVKEETAKKAEEKAAEEKAAPTEEKAAKPAPKKPGRKPGKTTTAKKKPVEKIQEVYVQYQDLAVTTQEIVDRIKQIYVSHGHRESSIKSLRVYVKPEERKAYYVINDKIMDSVDL